MNSLQLFQIEAREKNALQPESLDLLDSLIHDTSTRLRKLGNLESVNEKQLPGESIGIDYEASTNAGGLPPEAKKKADKPRG